MFMKTDNICDRCKKPMDTTTAEMNAIQYGQNFYACEVLNGPRFDKKQNCERYEVMLVVIPKDITITVTITI